MLGTGDWLCWKAFLVALRFMCVGLEKMMGGLMWRRTVVPYHFP